VLMACEVDAHHAATVAVQMLKRHGVYERPMGLVGVRDGGGRGRVCVHVSFLCGLGSFVWRRTCSRVWCGVSFTRYGAW
jgi:hypothetical protein